METMSPDAFFGRFGMPDTWKPLEMADDWLKERER